jgi:hypothetical protein
LSNGKMFSFWGTVILDITIFKVQLERFCQCICTCVLRRSWIRDYFCFMKWVASLID